MKRLNKYFEVSDDAVYSLRCDNYLIIKPGHIVARNGSHVDAWNGSHVDARYGSHVDARYGSRVDARNGSRVVAWSGSRVVAWNGSHVDARNGSHVDARYELLLLADDGEYKLRRSDDGYYYAGCRIALTAAEALEHWNRDDDRACLFTLAIGMAEAAE